jgi:MFS family permease
MLLFCDDLRWPRDLAVTTGRDPGREFARLLVVVYGPTLLFAVGQGAVLPVIALSARELGASVGVAGLVVALTGIGQLIGDVPAGALAERVGERRAMILSVFVTAVALGGCMLAPSVALLGLCIVVTGMTGAVFTLARQTYLTEMLPVHVRGRGMSALGGAFRIGLAVGPFIGAWAVGPMGTDGAYLVHLVAAAATLALLWFLPDLPGSDAVGPAPAVTMWGVFREHRQVLATVGVAALLIGAARNARITVIPLWCEHAGLDVAQTSLVAGAAGIVEIVLFYPAGALLDRLGRGGVGAVAMLVVAAGLAVLPLTHTALTITLASALVGLGNGLSSGLVLTLGADVAPRYGRSLFFGGWRLIADIGTAAGPMAVGAAAAAASLVVACGASAVLGLAAAGTVWRWAPPRPAPPPA